MEDVKQDSSEPGREELLALVGNLKSWRHRIELGHGVVTPGREDNTTDLSQLRLPSDMSGFRVLDVGCSDGFFSFHCEQRSAEVVAIDDFTSSSANNGNHGFAIAQRALRSKVNFHRLSIYDVNPERNGLFDIVLLLNVLYHLRHPMLALEIIYSVLKPGGVLYLKSYFHQDIRISKWGFNFSNRPIMRFFEKDELNRDPSNWWAPNRRCLESMLRANGFIDLVHLGTLGDRIYYQCRRE